jgi:2-polyprenyl-3-methyl-5-hydroxy-6-metoxy-1,4-benzoquinol methylase
MKYEWEAVDKCPVCGGAGVPSIENMDPEINEKITVYFCPGCKSSYHNPRMTEKSMHDYYSSGVYRDDPARELKECRMSKKTLADEIKITMVRIFAGDVGVKPKRCLDYGCSRGLMVKEMEKQFEAEAIGYDVYQDPQALIDVVTNKDEITGKFDLITCVHVLEHLPNPIEELEWMINRLEKDGIIFLELPMMRLVFPPHPTMFSRESLYYLMRRFRARYILYDMQYATDNVLTIFQPYHPSVNSGMSYHPTMVGYLKLDEK